MKKLFFILIIFIAFASCDKMDNNPIVNTNFNNHILEGYFVTSIAFDNLGNAWIGTFKQGLIKYNSKETIVYKSGNSVFSDTTVINDIAIDSKNNVWIACDGLVKYDGKKFTKYNSQNSPIPEDYVSSIAIDSKDNIWFSSSRFRQGGLVKYDNSNWTVYTPNNSDLPANLIKNIAIDSDDNVWIALSEVVNNSFLVKISNNKWSVITDSDLGFTPYFLSNISINSRNELYGSIDYSLSSSMVHNNTQVFIYNGRSTQKLKFDKQSSTTCMIVDNEDNIWCGLFGGGYAVYNGQKWIVEQHCFNNKGVFTIEQSPDKKIWIGTGSGIFINN